MPTELTATRDDCVLAGSLWLPAGSPVGGVLMHPGSGPADRDNDVYFPPIRDAFLAAGIAVASFDKRGVGQSTGRWEEADIATQADDASAAFGVVRDALGEHVPLGLFGHSQGGWVVLAAATAARADDRDLAFVVTNSGPGVSPAEQERYSAAARLLAAGAPANEIARAVARYDLVVELMRERIAFEDLDDRLRHSADTSAAELRSTMYLAETAAEWALESALIDHDPRRGFAALTCPVLALFGAEDQVVPVDASVAALRAGVPADLLTVEVLPGGDHRIQHGEALVPGYLPTLTRFVLDVCRRGRQSGGVRPL